MLNRLLKNRKFLLLLLDVLIIMFACSFSYIILNDAISGQDLWKMLAYSLILIVCLSFVRVFLRIYESMWRYADTHEYILLVIADFSGFCLTYVVAKVLFGDEFRFTFIVFTSMLSLIAALVVRFIYRQYRSFYLGRKAQTENQKHIAIIGAGYAGNALVEEIFRDKSCNYIPYCFIDDDRGKIGCSLHGVKVKGTVDDMLDIIKDSPVSEIIIAIPTISMPEKKRILDICAKIDCKVKVYEYPFERMKSPTSSDLKNQLRDISPEDLLCRDPISFLMDDVRRFIEGKVVLITGGGGSIGSELCRQTAEMDPARLIILDIYENNAYDIQQEMKMKYRGEMKLEVEIASVRDKEKVEKILEKYKPDIIFHAAAHKHVPLMEDCCDEAIKNNVMGTYNVIMAAEKYAVKKMVLISTDKAVNPTNIMGATKRICEMITESMKDSKTEYVSVRFGNVLGSNGSVIPLFRRQIENGGPVTITDKRIIRYFMTIAEAVQLVMQAAAMASKSEIFVLDMGNPVRIIDLAETMIRLAGLVPGKDIEIIETGLRPGEKLYEELLMKTESLGRTKNEKIFIERAQESITREDIRYKLDRLNEALENNECNMHIRKIMAEIVPTYKTPESVNCKFG